MATQTYEECDTVGYIGEDLKDAKSRDACQAACAASTHENYVCVWGRGKCWQHVAPQVNDVDLSRIARHDPVYTLWAKGDALNEKLSQTVCAGASKAPPSQADQ